MPQVVEHGGLGKVQKIKKKVGNRWGLSKQPINLMNKSNVATKYNGVIKLV